MKKLTVLAALLLAVSVGTTAFAATEYDPTEQSVYNTDQGSYQTVLIIKSDGTDDTADKIVYVDQADTSFDGAKSFLLKQNPTDGVYTIKFGGKDGQTMQTNFAIGVGISGYDTMLTKVGEPVESNGTYSWGFVTSDDGVDFSNGGIIIVKLGDEVMAYPTNHGITGNIKALFGVQIDEVPAGTDVEVYFRPGASVIKK